jgi:hypothetical protein
MKSFKKLGVLLVVLISTSFGVVFADDVRGCNKEELKIVNEISTIIHAYEVNNNYAGSAKKIEIGLGKCEFKESTEDYQVVNQVAWEGKLSDYWYISTMNLLPKIARYSDPKKTESSTSEKLLPSGKTAVSLAVAGVVAGAITWAIFEPVSFFSFGAPTLFKASTAGTIIGVGTALTAGVGGYKLTKEVSEDAFDIEEEDRTSTNGKLDILFKKLIDAQTGNDNKFKLFFKK